MSKEHEWKKLKHIIPLTRKIDGVYVNESDGALFRWPADYLGFFEVIAHTGEEWSNLRPDRKHITGEDTEAVLLHLDDCGRWGHLGDFTGAANFLGFEYDGKEHNWTDEVAEYLKKQQARIERQKVASGG